MQLRLAGSSLAEIARELDVAATTVTCVSQGYRRSRRIEAAIAQKLAISVDELWRDRYPPPDSSERTSLPNSQCKGGGWPSSIIC